MALERLTIVTEAFEKVEIHSTSTIARCRQRDTNERYRTYANMVGTFAYECCRSETTVIKTLEDSRSEDEMGWFVVTVAPLSAGDAIADHVLSRANNPATWSFESLGALVYRQKREDADSFFFCPKAAIVFEPLIATNDGNPCDSPLNRTLLQSGSWRLVLGFRTGWEPIKRPERKQRTRWELR